MKLNICRMVGVGSAAALWAASYALDPVVASALGKSSGPSVDAESRIQTSSAVIVQHAGPPLRRNSLKMEGGIRPTEAAARQSGIQRDPLAGWAKVVGLRQSFYEGPTRKEWSLNVGPEFQLSDWVHGRLALAGVLASVLVVLVVRRKRLEAREMLAQAALERARLKARVDYAHR